LKRHREAQGAKQIYNPSEIYQYMKILLIHGPNLNRLGQRDKQHYGGLTLKQLEDLVKQEANKNNCQIECYQSNHEGALIDFIQEHTDGADGIIINPGALTHYSYALHDALLDSGLPCVEVHLSDIKNREDWRRISVTAPACIKQISGQKEKGYIQAFKMIYDHTRNKA